MRHRAAIEGLGLPPRRLLVARARQRVGPTHEHGGGAGALGRGVSAQPLHKAAGAQRSLPFAGATTGAGFASPGKLAAETKRSRTPQHLP